MQPALYIMTNRPRGVLYTGVTSALVQRVHQHRERAIPGFTSRYNLRRLAIFELHETMDSAILREKRVKRWARAWKIELVEGANPTWRDLWQDICTA